MNSTRSAHPNFHRPQIDLPHLPPQPTSPTPSQLPSLLRPLRSHPARLTLTVKLLLRPPLLHALNFSPIHRPTRHDNVVWALSVHREKRRPAFATERALARAACVDGGVGVGAEVGGVGGELELLRMRIQMLCGSYRNGRAWCLWGLPVSLYVIFRQRQEPVMVVESMFAIA